MLTKPDNLMKNNLIDDDEDILWYGDKMYEALSPKIGEFLISYYGEKFYDLEADTYREINRIIKDEIILQGNNIPIILHRYCTIKDMAEWNEAFNKYQPQGTTFAWPQLIQWDVDDEKNENDEGPEDYVNELDYDDDEDNEEEDDDIDDIDRLDPNLAYDEEKGEKILFENLNAYLDSQDKFQRYLQQSYQVFNQNVHIFIENTSSFDLTYLTPEGFIKLQDQTDLLSDTIFGKLYNVLGAIRK